MSWFTAKEIASAFGVSAVAIYKRAEKEKWSSATITGTGPGGRRMIFGPLEKLPEDIRQRIIQYGEASKPSQAHDPIKVGSELRRIGDCLERMERKLHQVVLLAESIEDSAISTFSLEALQFPHPAMKSVGATFLLGRTRFKYRKEAESFLQFLKTEGAEVSPEEQAAILTSYPAEDPGEPRSHRQAAEGNSHE